MDWQTDLFFQRFDQHRSCSRFQQACHVFQAKNMRARRLQVFTHCNIIVQIIFRAVRVKNIARITNRTFTDLTVFHHCVHGHTHVFNPIQTVKNAEYIHTGFRGLSHKFLHYIIGIIGIPNAITGPQQHLCHQVWHSTAQISQPLPRTFLQETVSHIKRCPAPTFHAEKLRQIVGISIRHFYHIVTSHSGCQQRLVTITHRGIRDQ